MPLSRYQIRNEYSLADPELYRAAEKDDPEALLEGVAMAGLVGVLRQLGDLAEFAAELFHDLHEEVMVTAARGHSLIVRVQQLEAEIPAVEKAFLSQTSHSSFLYNPGIVWHPKMRMEKSLILSGDLPRFIMDSYEECRGPPRLFLLDKFDVAGAGACLKRYTDPSFFKLETSSSGTSGIDIQRERKIRKAKKKGSRWRNGETPEVLSMSHAKLHQLFLEERIENGITDPARRVKLRKRLNGFQFDTKSGKSYMERFLKSASADHNEVHDIPVDSSPSLLLPNGRYEPVSEIAEIKTMTPENESKERFTSPFPVKNGGTYQIYLPAEKLNEIASGTGLSDVLTSDSGLQAYNVRDPPCFEAYNVPSTPQVGNSDKVFPVDGGSSESVGDYKSDDIASEVEQYMDALTTIESEIDTDTELKAKSKLGYFNSRRQVSDVYVNDDQIQTISSESQSPGNSIVSDDGNSSSKKRISIVSSSDTQSPAPSDVEVSSIVFPCNHQLEVHDTTSVAQFAVAVKNTVSQAPGGTVSDDASTGIAEHPRLSSKLDNVGSDSVPLDLTTFHKNADSLETGKAPVGPEADKTLANMSLNTATTNTVQPPARDEPPSRVCCYNHFMDGFEIENHETGRNLCYSSCPCCPSNSKDESSFKEMLDDYGNKIDRDYQIFDENVASISCFLADPADVTNGNTPTHTNQNEMEELDGKDLNLSTKASLQSNISDVALRPREDSSPEMSGRNTPTVELDSLQPNSFVDIVTDKSYGQSLNCMPEARSAEDHHGHNSDEGQLGQQRVVIPFTEEHHLDPVAAEVDNNCPSTGEMTLNATSETNIGRESIVYVVQKVVGSLQSEQLKQGTSDSEEEHSERPCNTLGAAIMKREASCDLDLFETNCTSSPWLVGENFTQVHFSVPDSGAEREIIETTLGATAKKDISSELVYNDSELLSDVPFIESKQEISSSEKEHFERPWDTEIVAFSGCNFNHLEVDSLSIPSLLGDNVQVHLAVPSVSAEREPIEDADGSLVDLKKESLPAFEDEYIGPEAEKASPLDEPLELCVAHNLHHEKLDPPDSISALSDVDDFDRKGSGDTLASDNMHSDKNISVRSPAKQGEWEASFGEENVDSTVPSKVKEELLLTQAQMQGSEETDRVTTSEPMLESLSSQPLVSECLSQESNNFDVPGTMDSSNSFLLPSTSHVTVEEMPPLPPLPPAQWRITKLQHALPAQDNAKNFSPLFQSSDGQDTQLLNVVMGQSNLDCERSSSVSEHATEEVAHSCQSLMQMAPVPGHGDSKEEDEARLAFVPHLPDIGASENPYGEHTKFRNQTASRASSAVDDELRQWSECTTSQQPSMTEKDQPQHYAVSTTEGPVLWQPAVEDEHHKENGSVHMKLPRPRNPLIDAVVALDKSKLRKVTEHVRSQVEKVDDRDSILEQIRTKSFNLKPAVVSRPSIQGPATNLKVAAILEKAKTIRQAFVGSDEDDDNDSWSDS